MLARQILSGSPDRVFLAVKNASATAMSVGRGVVFDYYNTTQQDGYNVTWRVNATHHLGMLAGVVVHHTIASSGFGLVQCFGHVDAIAFSGAATSTAMSGFNADTLAGYWLYLLTGTHGCFETNAIGVAATTTTVHASSFLLANAAVYLGTTCPNGATVNTQETQTTVSVKGFIRAM